MSGEIKVNIKNNLGFVSFSHPKANSLPGSLLEKLAKVLSTLGKNKKIRIIVLQSEGNSTFCAGASFEEFEKIKNIKEAEKYFMGFAKVILALKSIPQIVIARVQGKVVGGGLGLVTSADYALATKDASARLSELSLGIGPFVIGPTVERKIGKAAFRAMSLDCKWRDASWCLEKGLYDAVYEDISKMDIAIEEMIANFLKIQSSAPNEIKINYWEEAKNWESLLRKKAKISAKCLMQKKKKF